MLTRTPVPLPLTATRSGAATADTAQDAVLARIAARVELRLAAEQAASSRTGDGSHAASLIWPWPL